MRNIIKIALSLLLAALMLSVAGCKKSGDAFSDTLQVDGTELEETDLEAEYEFRDIICNRALTEGKMAVYFFRSNYLKPKPSGVTTSGDSSLIIAPDGTTMLIDTNLSPITGRVVDYLQRLGISKLDYLLISHADVDHYGGYEALFNYIKVDNLLISESPDYMNTANKAGRCVAKAKELGTAITKLHAGMSLDFGDVHMDTLWPVADYEWTLGGNNSAELINGGSLVTKFIYKDSSYLFAGDLYVAQENKVVDTYGDALKSDIVKMSHHGLKTSNCDNWIVTSAPKLLCGMISTLKEDEILSKYMYYDIPFTYSIFDGTCVVYTNGDGVYDVQVEKQRDNGYFGYLDTDDTGHFVIK